MATILETLKQNEAQITSLTNKVKSLQSELNKQGSGMQKAADSAAKYRGAISKLGDKVENFMTSEEPLTSFLRRVVYSLRGFSILNKLNVWLRGTGKVWDSTIGKIIKQTPALGNILGQVKVPKKGMKERLREYSDYIQGSGLNIGAGEGLLRLGGKKTRERGVARRGAIKGFGRRVREGMRDVGSLFGTRKNPLTYGSGKRRGSTEMGFANLFNALDDNKNAKTLAKIARRRLLIDKIKQRSWKMITGVFKIAGRFLLKAMMFMIMTTAAIIGIVALAKIVYTFLQGFAGGVFTVFSGFFEDLKETFGIVWEGIQGIFGFLFGDTTFEEMIFGVLDSAYALLKLVVNFSLRFIGAVVVGIYKGLEELFFKGLEIFKGLKLKAKIGVVIAGIFAAVAWLYGFPILMPALILGALYMFGKWFIKKFDLLASGGTVSSPLQVVGERGPEIASLPRGSRVFSNTQSKRMVNNAGTQINNYITINARDTSDGEMRRIANKIGNMVNNKINRTTSSRTLG